MKKNLAEFTNGFWLHFQVRDSIFQLCKFQIYVEQLIFVVQKRLSYEKASIFDKKV